MAKQVEETLELILESAKKEFLENGFEKASLRTIAKNAKVTTGALYVRFPSKDALFSALVSPVANEMLSFYKKGEQIGGELLGQDKEQDMWAVSDEMVGGLVAYIFANRMAFILLIDKAAGSSYEHFLDCLVEEEMRQSMAFLDGMKAKGHAVPSVSQQDLHILLSAQFFALFEVIRHDDDKEVAAARIQTVLSFFRLGWKNIFGS